MIGPAAGAASGGPGGWARRIAPIALILLLSAAPARAQAPTPYERGQELRARLRAAGLERSLASRVLHDVQLGPEGARVGSLTLRTDLVEVDGRPVYRISDVLSLEVRGLGTIRLLVAGDLRADLSPLGLTLESEEPRGSGVAARQRIELRREGERWARYVGRGRAGPVRELLPADLPADLLVLTPPLGAGERLARLSGLKLGQRLAVGGCLFLETGEPATLRLSSEDEVAVPQREGPARAASRLLRLEGPATTEALLADGRGRLPLRLAFAAPGRPARLVCLPSEAGRVELGLEDPRAAVCVLLRALAAEGPDERARAGAALRASLDVDALYRAAGGAGDDAPLRAAFEAELLERLLDAGWLKERGLHLIARAADPEDLVATRGGERARVAPRRAPAAAFELERRAGRWRIVALPGRVQ